MTKKLILLCILLLNSQKFFAQGTIVYKKKLFSNQFKETIARSNNYYLTDKQSHHGIKIIDQGDKKNAESCVVENFGKEKSYSPYEVVEYGFSDGRKYVSREVSVRDTVRRYFLEILHQGKIDFYYLKSETGTTFFYERDSSGLVQIARRSKNTKQAYKDLLVSVSSDCEAVNDAARLVSYNKQSLKRYGSVYEKCVKKPFPHKKYGIIAGYKMSMLKVEKSLSESYLNEFDYSWTGSPSAGIFIDLPINASFFSFHFETGIHKYAHSYNVFTENRDIDLVINTTGVSMPFMLRYTLPINGCRPFFNAGFVFDYNFRNKSDLYEAIINSGSIEIQRISSGKIVSDGEWGALAGIGIEIRLNYRKSLFFEIRRSMQFGLRGSGELNKSEVHFITGINF